MNYTWNLHENNFCCHIYFACVRHIWQSNFLKVRNNGTRDPSIRSKHIVYNICEIHIHPHCGAWVHTLMHKSYLFPIFYVMHLLLDYLANISGYFMTIVFSRKRTHIISIRLTELANTRTPFLSNQFKSRNGAT